MYNRDYSKEVGLDSGEKIVPWRYLIPAAAFVFALCWLGFVTLSHAGDSRRAHAEQVEPSQHS